MHGKDWDSPAEICAVIGRAVSELIRKEQPLGKKNVLAMLQQQSKLTSDEKLKAVYLQALRHILESFH
ncbi:hypothetical protein Q3V30_10340 [Erwinia pyri]|uniref:Uncharacterized protein n=1 Tax=Erwinia pyri TaxID=3062598 RepID=A0AA50HPZ8_9GAMM|nr:hypothetical protein [Erwinia sp. DE2]WLS80842.1 hypothetical protein Q3V30_10340 [Erwinia sp. DE2]